MKLELGFKRILAWTSALLYTSGLAVWILSSRFQIDTGYGFEPSPIKVTLLHAHSVIGLIFIALFGYLWGTHIEPGLRQQKKRLSGWTLLSLFIVLFLTVPALFYATDASLRASSSTVHTWLGATILAPFLIHWRGKKRRLQSFKKKSRE